MNTVPTTGGLTAFGLSLVIVLTACSAGLTQLASDAQSPSDHGLDTKAVGSTSVPPEQDRAAILAMQGEYRIQFAFDETVLLREGRERAEPHRSRGNEVVIVVEDTGDRIVLQHLLVGRNGHVTKHWRQDWHFQAAQRLEFVSDQVWALRPVPVDRIQGSWTQCVYEVSDAPRYCGTGTWNHRYGAATWTSDRTWRPLPRREHTTRSDYNALNVENRHTITPAGWTHEQDNTKVVRDGERTADLVAREFGFNDYRRVDDVDFSPAYRYWEATSGYWAEVRARWQEAFDQGRVELRMPVDGMPLIRELFGQAARVEQGEPVPPAEISRVFDSYVVTGPEAMAGLP